MRLQKWSPLERREWLSYFTSCFYFVENFLQRIITMLFSYARTTLVGKINSLPGGEQARGVEFNLSPLVISQLTQRS
jgi:hypothetical protein